MTTVDRLLIVHLFESMYLLIAYLLGLVLNQNQPLLHNGTMENHLLTNLLNTNQLYSKDSLH